MKKGSQIAVQIEALREQMQIPKVKMGIVLGAADSDDRHYKYQKYQNFIARTKRGILDISALEKIAQFFNKPIEFFTADDTKIDSHNIQENRGGNQVLTHGNISTSYHNTPHQILSNEEQIMLKNMLAQMQNK